MDDPYRTTDATPPSGYPNADDTEPQTPSPAPWDAPTASDSTATPAPYEPPTYEPPVFNAPWQSTPLPPAYTTPPSAPVYPPQPPTYTPPAYTAPPVYSPPSYNAPMYGPPPSQPLYTPNPSIPLAQPPMQPVPSQPVYGQPVYGQPIPPVPQSGYLVPVPIAPQQYYAPPVVIVQQSDNSGLAIVLEVLGGLFGLFGIGWLIAGETTTGLLMLIGGFVWIGVAVVLSILTFGLFGFCLVPINLGAMITSAVMLNNKFKQKRMIVYR